MVIIGLDLTFVDDALFEISTKRSEFSRIKILIKWNDDIFTVLIFWQIFKLEDGSFTKKLILGDGVAAKLLKENEILVFSEDEIGRLDVWEAKR